jgi:rhamnogalacturonan endolyase
MEMWSICTDGIRDVNGRKIASPKRLSQNMGNWWDGDLLRELLDKTYITKYNWKTRQIELLTSFLGVSSNNGTKSVPCLQGDILGDWREEVLLRSTDNEHIYLFLTPYPTEYRFNSFLQDIPYRLGLAVENVGYNQPTQPGFFFGEGMKLSQRNKCK